MAAERGPFECDNGCQIGYPKPDPATLDYIERMKPLFNRWFGDVFWNKGDIYIVCNATYCAKYYITDDFGIFGTNDGRMEREGGDSGSGNASGGGEAGGQGGYNPGWDGGGGGSTGGGTGTVYVGDPQTVQE
ncbi:hypothetical protein ASE43_00380 [Lysobacter sp. Root983]|nr:hypothetical protein ASD69_03585 [Lysobacter sp. Root604]KRD39452.1 hypothetical protein ASE35_03600 [Lysobacter sp. Root916]KRD79423.1 hypothetical protein ASE43_00380 [Lysobacter sp. Root983]